MALEVLLGGARSGKSALAVRRARAQPAPVTFVATGRRTDPDMAARIDRHRAERPGGWTTVEEPVELERTLADTPADACLIVDCLTLWVANLLDRGDTDGAVEDVAVRAARRAADRPGRTVAISNEVGMGVHPEHAAGRRYRDVLGRVNAAWATAASDAALVVAGRLLPLERVGEDA